MHIISFLEEESGPLKNPTDKFEMKFESAGTFEYKCSIYTRMRGKIEVVEDGSKPKRVTASSIKDMQKLITNRPQQKFTEEQNQNELSQRLIEVLDTEDDLCNGVQADNETPPIKQNFFQEIFEKKMMGLHGADLSTDENKTENPTDSDEETAFMINQRKKVH